MKPKILRSSLPYHLLILQLIDSFNAIFSVRHAVCGKMGPTFKVMKESALMWLTFTSIVHEWTQTCLTQTQEITHQ